MTQTIEIDGFIVDQETGEVLGHAESGSLADDRDRLVGWALKKRAEALASAAGLEAHMNLLIAGVKERLETQIREAERKAAWIESAYGLTIQSWAEDNIPAGKKSVKHDWATVGFRSSRESTKILDPEKALAFCKMRFPEAIKIVESVLVSEIPDAEKPALPADAFEFHPAGEAQQFFIN